MPGRSGVDEKKPIAPGDHVGIRVVLSIGQNGPCGEFEQRVHLGAVGSQPGVENQSHEDREATSRDYQQDSSQEASVMKFLPVPTFSTVQ